MPLPYASPQDGNLKKWPKNGRKSLSEHEKGSYCSSLNHSPSNRSARKRTRTSTGYPTRSLVESQGRLGERLSE